MMMAPALQMGMVDLCRLLRQALRGGKTGGGKVGGGCGGQATRQDPLMVRTGVQRRWTPTKEEGRRGHQEANLT